MDAIARPEDHEAVKAGAGADFDTFFRSVFPKAVAVARRITGDAMTAEDVALDSLAKAHFRWRRVGGLEWRDAWVLKVAAHEALRRLPKPRQLTRPAAAGTDDHADGVALRQTLRAALMALPRRQREVVVLRHLVGLSEPEVAVALDLSLGTVKTHLRRGLSGLRKSFDLDLEEDHLARLT
jgi:RNA polymerase sigma factor (sigma-70 family)